jgi:flagellar basal-body rod modification protein FlgD
MSALSPIAGRPSAATPTPVASPSATSAAPSASETSSLSGLSQSDFLQLLIAQMQNQDPMSPTSATDFMTELADFSTVEGMTQLNSSVTFQNMEQSAFLIGQTVEYTAANGTAASGVVDAVNINDGQVALSINNTDVSLNQLTSIE